MVSEKYAKAYTEVLEIISHFSDEEYKMIPKEKIKFYEDNCDKNYEFKIDPEVDLENQEISKEACAVIVNLYMDYFADDEQKEKINEILAENQEKAEQEKREKYNPDNLFKNRKNTTISNESVEKEDVSSEIIEYKSGFFEKIKNFILKIFHINVKN